MKASAVALNVIRNFEGLRFKAYKCKAGKWTIGYGSTFYENGAPVKEGDVLTSEAQAARLLQVIVTELDKQVNDLLPVTLKQNEYDAIISLVYNIGTGNFRSSTMRKMILAGNMKDAADQFDKWIYVKKKKDEVLIKRRALEKRMFLR